MEVFANQVKLSCSLGTVDGVALIFSNVVGAGIFTTSGLVLQSVPDSNSFLLVWLVGGIIALIGAFAYARLSSLYPQSGGEYVYLSKVFGPLAGFLTGWTSLVAGFSGAIAASAVGFASYLTSFTPLSAGEQTGVAVLLIMLTSLVHIVNVRAGSRMNYLLCLMTVAAVALVFVATILYSGPYQSNHIESENTQVGMWAVALIPVIFSYSGWNAAAYVAEEIKDQKRNIRKTLVIGTLTVTLLYLLMNLLYIKIIPWDEMVGTVQVGDLLARKLMGPSGAWLITGIILVALVSSVSAMIMSGPRIYFAMARDGLLPKRIRELHPTFRTPLLAIAIQSLWSIVLVLSGSFEQILVYTGFSIILFSAITVLALLVLEQRNGSLLRVGNLPYLIFVMVSVLIVLGAVKSQHIPSTIGVLIIGLGIPFYYMLRRRKK